MTIQANQGFGVSIFGATSAGGGGSTSPGGSSGQLQYNASGSFGGMAGTSWDDTNRALTLTGATVTTSQPVLNLSQTWNAGAVTFTGLKFNATDTASGANSLLLDLQIGGSSIFKVSKTGSATTTGYYYAYGFSGTLASITTYDIGGFSDTYLTRAAAATLRLGQADAAAPVAQTLQVQSVVAGTSNTAGANWTLKGSAGTGTGAGGSIIFQVAPAGTTGTAQNAYATALTIGSDQNATFAGTVAAASSSAAAVAFARNGSAGTGIFFPSSANIGIAIGGGGYANFSTTAFAVNNDYAIGWRSGAAGSAVDLTLFRDAANTLALRNGANAQAFNVYNTYTDASNYERAALTWSSNVAYLRAQNAGTGSARLMVPVTGSTTVASLPSASTAGAGARSFVTDANATTFLSTVAGGGANKVPVVSDGTNWLIG